MDAGSGVGKVGALGEVVSVNVPSALQSREGPPHWIVNAPSWKLAR
jgi:hypothetical protein